MPGASPPAPGSATRPALTAAAISGYGSRPQLVDQTDGGAGRVPRGHAHRGSAGHGGATTATGDTDRRPGAAPGGAGGRSAGAGRGRRAGAAGTPAVGPVRDHEHTAGASGRGAPTEATAPGGAHAQDTA